MNTTPRITCMTFKAEMSDVLRAYNSRDRARVLGQFEDPDDMMATTASGAVIRRMFILDRPDVDADHWKISGFDWEGADVLESLAAILREGGRVRS